MPPSPALFDIPGSGVCRLSGSRTGLEELQGMRDRDRMSTINLFITLFSKRSLLEKSVYQWVLCYTWFWQCSWQQLAKTPFQNWSWFSHDLKMFEYISRRWNRKTEFLQELGSLHFFWGRVYFSETAVIHHFHYAPGNNLQKTASQNSSRFFHNHKMFQDISSQ